MILQALYQLARDEGLAEDLDFQMAPVGRVIALGGGSATLIPRMEAPAAGKGKPRAIPMPIPRQEGRTSSDKAYFLVDKAEYVLGWDPCGRQTAAKLTNRHQLFRAEVEQALKDQPAGSMEQRALQAVLAFLDLPEEARAGVLLEELGPTPSDAVRKDLASVLFAFVFVPAGPDPVHLLPGIQAHWRARREQAASGQRRPCLVTGEPCVPAKVHPAIKGVPGGNAAGAALVSFNKPAFESYGLSGGENAPIGRQASETFAAALNRLLASAPVHPDGSHLPRRNLHLSEDTVALFWNSHGGSDLDWLLELNGDDPDHVRLALESPRSGRPAPLQDPSRFCTLLLSGAQGRSIVRSFLDSSTRAMAHAVQAFLGDTRIERPFGKGIGNYPLWILLRSLAAQGKTENLPPSLAAEIYLAAVRDSQMPRLILSTAVRRNRAEGPAKEGFAARCALIRASLIRREYPSRKEIPMSLDPSRREPAYQLGRLLATLDKCQQEALGSVNATLTDRYYGAASSTPGTAFPTLLRNNRHHVAKLRKERTGTAIYLEGLLQEILDRLDSFPGTLRLQDQGLFALGFHHQRQSFFTKKSAPVPTA